MDKVKVKISLMVRQVTVDKLDHLATQLFPHITVSRGDVVEYLVAETLRVMVERGSALSIFPQREEAAMEVKGE